MKNLIYIILPGMALLNLQQGHSQVIDPVTADYSVVDAHVLSLDRHYRDIDKLVNDLTGELTEDYEKTRAIFRWIASNIEYDVKAFHRSSAPIRFTYSTEEELQRLLAAENERIVNEVLKNRRAVCDGYSRLFITLCEKSGIEAEAIDGYGRNNLEIRRGTVLEISNHTWNAVKLNNRWYLLDPTWASGYTNPGVTKFTRKFRQGFYLTPPEKFILDHFPEDPGWQLLEKKISWSEFVSFPLVKGGFLEYNISEFIPKEGTIRAKAGKSIAFEFTSDGKINEILVHQSNERYSKKTNFDKKGNRYRFHCTVERRGNYVITIFVNGESTLMYRVEVR